MTPADGDGQAALAGARWRPKGWVRSLDLLVPVVKQFRFESGRVSRWAQPS